MAAPQITERTRKRLLALLGENRLRSDRLMARLQELRALEGVPSCSAVVRLLAHMELPEDEAEVLLMDILEHRQLLADRLGRDPGLHVAAIDLLSNVRKVLNNPMIVELADWQLTERSAVTDPLTELYNRRYFHGALDLEVRRSRRYVLQLSLIMLDLDSFKAVNDLYGHPFGDRVLQRAGQVIRRAVRESDAPCRFGGDEFVIILPETSRLGAYAVAERIRRGIRESFARRPIEQRVLAMTVSGGIASYPADGEDAGSLLARADQALYRSKSRGSNQVTIYHSERRGSVRFPLRPSSTAGIAGGADDDATRTRALNLSLGGVLLETTARPALHDAVELQLAVGSESWVAAGRVVRVEPRRRREAARRIAVAFDRVLPDECLRRNALQGRSADLARGDRV